MRDTLAAGLFASFLFVFPAAASDSSLRCTGGLVSLGDATIDLLGKCGAPTLREPLVEVSAFAARVGFSPLRESLFVASERWSYDFGPQRFQMFVVLEAGKVSRIEQGNRGYSHEDPEPVPIRRAACDSSAIHNGDTKTDLLARCGEPVIVDVRPLADLVAFDAYRGVVASRPTSIVDVEVWTYDFGAQQFVRFVYLEGGLVRLVETGGYGYAR
jgi:hypothetical protein